MMFPDEYLKMKTIEVVTIEGKNYNRKTETVAVGECDGECVETAELFKGKWYTNVIGLTEYEI